MTKVRISRFLLCVYLLAVLSTAGMLGCRALAASNAESAAAALEMLGLFRGSASGYNLERRPTRAEGFAMLIRFMGAEAEAQQSDPAKCPFTDIGGKWFEQYAAYAYQSGLTTGVGGSLFAPDRTITAQEYSAMLLRALEYEFLYENAVQTAENIGIFNYLRLSSGHFTRADMVLMSYGALFCDNINTGEGFLQQLLKSGTITADKLKNVDFAAVRPVRSADEQTVDDGYFSLGTKKLKIGMKTSQIEQVLGKPDRTDASPYGFAWQVYNSDYAEFIMVGVDSAGAAVAFYSNSDGTHFRGVTVGRECPKYSDPADSVLTVFTDIYDSNKVDGLLVVPRSNQTAWEWTDAMTAAAERQLMDFANAERVNRGLDVLEWSDAAARAAKQHSADMSAKGYFSHDSDDGRTLSDRLTECGVFFTSAAENIAQGYMSSFAVHHAWMNSEGHRANLLEGKLKRFGAGVTADRYYTEDFFAA